MKKKSPRSFMDIYQRYGIYIILLLMIVILSVLSDNFFTKGNVINILRQITVNGIMTLGVTMILITGGIDLSVGGIMALAGVYATSFAHTEGGLPMGLVLLIGLGVGGFFGLVNGLIVSYTNVSPFIVTLGMESITRGLCLLYTQGSPVTDLMPSFKVLGQSYTLGIPNQIYVYILMVVLAYILLHELKFGRHVFAVGGNETAAKVSGIHVRKVKTLVYLYAGVLYGLVGVMLASRTNAATPNAGMGYELSAISAAVIGGVSINGGKGTIFGAVAGVFIIGILGNGMDILNISSYIQQIIKGIIIIGAVCIDQARPRE